MSADLIAAISALAPSPATLQALPCSALPQTPAAPAMPSFADVVADGAHQLQQRIDHADQLVRSYALGEDVPIHQVTIALEEARIAVEFAVQMRTRLIEAYREIMNMQL